MITILMDRHSGTEQHNSSLYTVFNDLEMILSTKFELVKLPVIQGTNAVKRMQQWIIEHAKHCDLFIGSSSWAINALRDSGWNGKVIFMALGSMPRGAVSLRNCSHNLYRDDVVWFTCAADKEIYENLFCIKDSPQIVVIPFGVHTDVFYPLDEQLMKSIRKKYNFGDSDYIMLYSGRITIEKNVHGIIEALAILVKMKFPIKLVLVGRIEDISFYEFKMLGINIKKRIESLIKKHNLNDHIVFIDWVNQNQLNELFNIANVIVNFSLHHDENYGFSQVQAMAAGKPLIGTSWGGFKDYIVDKVTGYSIGTYVSNFGIRYDMPGLVIAIIELFSNQNLRKKLGNNALHYINNTLNFGIYTDKIISLVENTFVRKDSKVNYLRFTDFGFKFHKRFSQMEDGKMMSLHPQYDGFADEDYKQLIKPYTNHDSFIKKGSKYFIAITGEIIGSYFVSTDILYQFRYKLNLKQIKILESLNRYYGTSLNFTTNEELNELTSLLQSGVIGKTSNGFENLEVTHDPIK
ncbi:glycosyltransferase family 4 protein [Paenibacillus lautus]|uniref:glycosyltransferase family 4 protein n=1 Tax=Paenibacillus lautus TaxID=1401 RepID=UPI003D2C892A